MDIKKKDLNELKVMVYDLIVQLEVVQNNIKALNQEINSRSEIKKG